MTLFLAFVIAMLVSMALIPPLMKAAMQFRVVDVPNERKLHACATPRVGGVAIIAGALLPIVAWAAPDARVIGLLSGMGIVFLFGFWDDWRNLDYRLKFLGQLLAVLMVVVYGGVVIRQLPLFDDYTLPLYVAIPVTVFVLVGITNAINLSDGLDGLAAGMTMMSLGVIAVLALFSGQTTVVLVSIAVIGAIVGFIRFNTHPASVFMGDGGSQFLGFTVGVLSLWLTQTPTFTYSRALPLVILALPLLDTATVFAQRLYEGRSPFAADRNHLHHKLLALGLYHHEAVLVLYALQAALFVSAYWLRFESDVTILVFCGLLSVALLGFLFGASAYGWRLRQQSGAAASERASEQRYRRFESQIARGILALLAVAAPAYLLIGAWSAADIATDVAVLALAMMLVLIGSFIRWHGQPLGWIERAAIYITVCMVVYLTPNLFGIGQNARLCANLFFVALAVVLMLALRYSEDKKFEPTTLDFLVLFVAVAVPNLPGLKLLEPGITETITRAIVLLYSIELVLVRRRYFWDSARVVACVSLAFVGIHALARLM